MEISIFVLKNEDWERINDLILKIFVIVYVCLIMLLFNIYVIYLIFIIYLFVYDFMLFILLM